MARNEQLNNGAIGVTLLGGILFLIGLILFFSSFMGAARSIENAGRDMGLFGSTRTHTSSFPLQPITLSGSGAIANPARTSPNIGAGVAGALLMAVGGFMVRVGIGMGLVANAKPIARWVGGVTGHARSRHGRYQAFHTESVEQPVQKIQVRCQHCTGLNDESARFCSQCGKEMMAQT